MKLKYNIIKGIIIACFLCGGASLYAQGLFSDDESTNTSTDAPVVGGLFTDDNLPGSGDDGSGTTGDGKDPAPGDNSPIGEGVVILSLLSAAYAMVKRNIKSKYED